MPQNAQRALHYVCIAFMLPCLATAQAATPLGNHRMALITPGGDLPFNLSIESQHKNGWSAAIINGDERIEIPAIKDGEDLVLPFPHYDSEVRLTFDHSNQKLAGEWIKRRGTKKETRLRVVSRKPGQRFDLPREPSSEVQWPNGRYRVTFEKSDDPALGEFSLRNEINSNCQGTFLTTLGDYRYLAGNSDGQQMKLSCFDGAHAFLFHGQRQEDGSIQGEFWSSNTWHETWSATEDPKAELPNGWDLTKWRQGVDLELAHYLDLTGKPRALTDQPFAGKARIVEVFGSWCPNCHDHGDYMAELDRRYRDQGLQVIGIAFEHDANFARSVRQIKTFMKRHLANFPILIGGLSNKKAAGESLGLVDKIRSFPTTIFIDKHDKVRGIYQGWSGPATGETYKRLRQRFEALIETMLREK